MIRRLAVLLALLPSLAGAQVIRYIPPPGATFTGGTITTPILAPNGSAAAPSYSFSAASDTGIYRETIGSYAGLTFVVPGTQVFDFIGGTAGSAQFAQISNAGFKAISTGALSWSSTNDLTSTADLFLYRDAANVLAQRNGTGATPQMFRAYKNWTDASNGAWLEISAGHASSLFGTEFASVASMQNGSGVELPLLLGTKTTTVTIAPASSSTWTFDTTGAIYAAAGSGRRLTAATMAANTWPQQETVTSSYYWTNAQVVAALGGGTTGDISVATLPAKTQVVDALVVITGAASGPATLTVACGRTGATYIDYIVASDAKAAANTVYGDAAAERGTNLTGYDLPSYTGTTTVTCHFVAADTTAVTSSTGLVILTTRLLP